MLLQYVMVIEFLTIMLLNKSKIATRFVTDGQTEGENDRWMARQIPMDKRTDGHHKIYICLLSWRGGGMIYLQWLASYILGNRYPY